MKMNFGMLIALPFVMNTANATQECNLLIKPINNENVSQYKKMVQNSLSQNISLSKIDITQVLRESEWTAISASTTIAEPGILFFKDNSFVDVWGGDVYPQDKIKLLKWAHDIHAPDKLVQCLFESVVIK